MNKDNITPLYNGISKYYTVFINNFTERPCVKIEKIDQESILYALISMVSLDIIYNKEEMVKQKDSSGKTTKTNDVEYESIMSDKSLDILLYSYNQSNEGNLFKDGATLFAFVRNKIAHGDFEIDIKNNNFKLKKTIKENGNDIDVPITVNINTFLNNYINIVNGLDVRKKCNCYTKTLLLNKSNLLDKIIDDKKDLDSLLSLMHIKKYTIRRKDNKDLTTEEKMRFNYDINELKKKLVTDKDIKYIENQLIEKYEKYGYYVNINKSKIKDSETKEKVWEIIKQENEIFDNYILEEKQKRNGNIPDDIYEIGLRLLKYSYGERINKLITENYEQKGINVGINLNEIILKEMYQTGNYNIDQIVKNNDLHLDVREMLCAIDLARFYSIYCYPLEKSYEKDSKYRANIENINKLNKMGDSNNIYVYERHNNFNFDKIDLSDLQPKILEIDTKNKTDVTKDLDEINKKIKRKEEKIAKKRQNIEKLIDSTNTKEELKKEKLNLLRDQLLTLYKSLDKLKLDEYVINYNKELIDQDYEQNPLYFRNRDIIKGIRNSISHGNVYLTNIGYTNNLYDMEMRFEDIYEGKKVFELTTSIYNFDTFFEPKNINENEKFIYRKK